jgi:thymidylate kinase
MQSFIFEGIATSGKSTIINGLAKTLHSNLSVSVAGEDETHIPIMNQRQELHIEFFKSLLKKLISNKPDLILIDRLYMTQAFRARCSLDVYKNLEEFLQQCNPMTVFLKIDEKVISERIQKATEHREPEWAEYVKSRGEEAQIADYYISQQRSQLTLLDESLVPYRIFDTTHHDYEAVIKKLIASI